MAIFTVEVPIAAPAELVWKRLTDWPAHARLAPLTTIRVIGPADQVGSVFVARTGVRKLAFDDSMEIEEFVAPRPAGDAVEGDAAEGGGVGDGVLARFRVRKTGWAVRGWIVAELRPGPEAEGQVGTRLVWTEEVRVPPEPLTRLAGPLIGIVARAGYGAALRKLGREIEEEARG